MATIDAHKLALSQQSVLLQIPSSTVLGQYARGVKSYSLLCTYLGKGRHS